jgi:hypothetical protein
MIVKGGETQLRNQLAASPEGRLIAAIFVRALHDYSKQQNKSDQKKQLRSQAYRWLMAESDILKLAVWLLDVDIDELRDQMGNRDFIDNMFQKLHSYYLGSGNHLTSVRSVEHE